MNELIKQPKALRLADQLRAPALTPFFDEPADELIRLHALNVELVEALRRIMDLDCPITRNPTHSELVEHWEYEKTQGRGEADDRLFALAAIAKATGAAS